MTADEKKVVKKVRVYWLSCATVEQLRCIQGPVMSPDGVARPLGHIILASYL